MARNQLTSQPSSSSSVRAQKSQFFPLLPVNSSCHHCLCEISRKLLWWKPSFVENEHFTPTPSGSYIAHLVHLGPFSNNWVLSACNIEHKESTWFTQSSYHPVFLHGCHLYYSPLNWLISSCYILNILVMCQIYHMCVEIL